MSIREFVDWLAYRKIQHGVTEEARVAARAGAGLERAKKMKRIME